MDLAMATETDCVTVIVMDLSTVTKKMKEIRMDLLKVIVMAIMMGLKMAIMTPMVKRTAIEMAIMKDLNMD